MTKKTDKRLCWNCEGGVSSHSEQCPYCGVDVTQPRPTEGHSGFNHFKSPFHNQSLQEIPQPPYAKKNNNEFTVTKEEWETSLNEPKEETGEEEPHSIKKEVIAFLLLLPGVVFFLFGLVLVLFSHDGMLMLRWNQQVAIFYFLGAAPLVFFGWRAFKK